MRSATGWSCMSRTRTVFRPPMSSIHAPARCSAPFPSRPARRADDARPPVDHDDRPRPRAGLLRRGAGRPRISARQSPAACHRLWRARPTARRPRLYLDLPLHGTTPARQPALGVPRAKPRRGPRLPCRGAGPWRHRRRATRSAPQVSPRLLRSVRARPGRQPDRGRHASARGLKMNFRSDNEAGAHPAIIEAVGRAFTSGNVFSYGEDEWTQKVERRLRDIFEKPDLSAYPFATGTAANVLALACCMPRWCAVFCHPALHIAVYEANAPQFYTAGATPAHIDGAAGKIDPRKLASALAEPVYGVVHHPQPAAVSITQATECGTVYAPEEIAAISTSVRRHSLKLHMDGARFANALSFVGCMPAELTWKAGVDVLSLGATKNGAMGAEVVVFFDTALAREFEFR